ncbi:HTTM domain-containing protein [Polyangium aurulentum]|uniref:HTTM domain-containing protein n=1 Tax=Polyangium aurulentum TaxID=2567896 RepID=UPI0010AE6BE9|nr:HTTM domain-containing protein [Polyangium aurulentum]UQA58749.1 HTTM domain-containing protein [Polyangium aurulentum]
MKARTISSAWGTTLRFFFAPAEATPLAALRIGLAAVLLVQAALVAPAFFALYDRAGFLQADMQDALVKPGMPHLGWLVSLLSRDSAPDTPILVSVAILYVLSLVALLVGLRARIAAALAWLLHATLMMTGYATSYGADNFAHIFLFYLVWMPSGDALSLDRLISRRPHGPTWSARLGLRVAQIHLCIVYLASGIAKASGRGWWNGAAMWEALTMPDFRTFDFSWLARHEWLAVLGGWSVLLWELGYAALVWPRRTRRLWVIMTMTMHLGIMIFLGLYVFGAVMIVLTTSAFAVSAEPGHPPAKPET